MDWIKVPVKVRDDPRFAKLAQNLGTTFHGALGFYVSILAYCGDHETRDLPASVTGEERKALKAAGLLGTKGLVDYADAVKALSESRARTRERKASERARTKVDSLCKSLEPLDHVTGTSQTEREHSGSLDLDPDLSSFSEDLRTCQKPLNQKQNETEDRSEALIVSREKGGWAGRAGDDMQAEYKGVLPRGMYVRITNAIGPIQEARGWTDVRKAWQRYLRETDATYASPERFAATYGKWAGLLEDKAPRDAVSESIDRGLAIDDPDGAGMARLLRGMKGN